DEEAALLGHRDDVAEVGAQHRLPAGDAEPPDADAVKAAEELVDLRQAELGRIHVRAVTVGAAEVAPVRDGEGGGEGPRGAVDVVREEARAKGVAEAGPFRDSRPHAPRRDATTSAPQRVKRVAFCSEIP